MESKLIEAYQAIAKGSYAAAHTLFLEYRLSRAAGSEEPKQVAGSLMSGDHFVEFCEHEIRQRFRDALRQRHGLTVTA